MKYFTPDNTFLNDRDRTELNKHKNLWKQYYDLGDYESANSAHKSAEAIRNGYGYSGGDDGSRYLINNTQKPRNGKRFSNDNAPKYTPQYDDEISKLMSNLQNTKPFSYHHESDPIYQQYKEQYTKLGARAMDDTIGKVSARTGGLASSFATSAAQQANNFYLSELTNKIPELEQNAYTKYQNTQKEKRSNLDQLLRAEKDNYGKFTDALGQYNNDRNFDYKQFSDDWNREHSLNRETIDDQYRQDEIRRKRDDTAWKRAKSDQKESQSIAANQKNTLREKAKTMAQYGNFSGYRALGYTEAELAWMKADYDRKHAKK